MKDLNKSTLAEQIYDILREDIISRKIQPGEKLTLKALQQRFDVSSTPIRDALTRLTEDCLVTYYSNVGIKVVELTRKDLEEIYELMGHLDGLAIRYAFLHESPGLLLPVLEENQRLSKKALAEGDSDKWIFYSENFHLIFYSYCGNGRLTAAAAKLRSQLTILANSYERQPEYQKMIENQHDEILQAAGAGSWERAELLMQNHLRHSLELALRLL